jgi:ABC-2 type transport system permease protein
MNDQTIARQATARLRPEPGVPVIAFLNLAGMRALYVKEVRRFFKVQLQTIWGPAATTLLYLVIFTLALGRAGRMEMGVPFADFLAPGLIVMGMIQSSFANASFSLLVGKMQGTIVDYLMPPISVGELMGALIGAALTRAVLVGLAIWLAMLVWPDVHVGVRHVWAVVYFGVMGAAFVALIGLITSLWAQKFDHMATVTNFIIQPLSLLSGTFYAIDKLHGGFRLFSQFNPFFYIISGFRYGFLGQADSHVALGAGVLLGVNAILAALCYVLLQRGWKLKA